jgi:hypothetical protein
MDKTIKTGDTVECIRPKGAALTYNLKADRMYRVDCSNRLRRVVSHTPLEDIKWKTTTTIPAVTQDEIQDKVCEFCNDHYEWGSSLCEGTRCEETMDMYLENNNLKLKEEDDMRELNVDANVMAVFGDNKVGTALAVINRHFNVDMLQRIVMKKYSKEIVAECEAAQEKLDTEKKS